MRCPSQVSKKIIESIAIEVGDDMAIWSRPYERLGHKSMNEKRPGPLSLIVPIRFQGDFKVAALPTARF